MIKVRNLHKSFGDHQLFKGLEFDSAPGEVVALIGPSGSGKSTFLRCINGLEAFDRGEIDVDDIALHEIDRSRPSRQELEAIRQVRLQVGMVFQQFNLFPHLTVLENITLAPVEVLGADPAQAEAEALAFLRRINLEHRARPRKSRSVANRIQAAFRSMYSRALRSRPKTVSLPSTSMSSNRPSSGACPS